MSQRKNETKGGIPLISKVVKKADALAKIESGQTIMIGDFLGFTAPDELIEGMVEKGVKDLTLIAITTGKPDEGCGRLVKNKQIKKAIVSHIGTNPLARAQMDSGEMEIEFVPQGTLAERIRCGGSGLGGVLTPTGIGTPVEEGKQKLTINGKEYLLELPLHADVALVKAWRADTAGNLQYWRSGVTNNQQIAMAADFVIAEAEELVEFGSIDPDQVGTPAALVDMVFIREKADKKPMQPSWIRLREGGKK